MAVCCTAKGFLCAGGVETGESSHQGEELSEEKNVMKKVERKYFELDGVMPGI